MLKVCEKVQSKPKKIFDAVNKIWKNESDIQKTPATPKAARKQKKSTKSAPEDSYKTCDFCRRKFCENAFDRHVEFCREKSNRISSSPVKDVVAQAKLIARTKYNPKEAKQSEWSRLGFTYCNTQRTCRTEIGENFCQISGFRT